MSSAAAGRSIPTPLAPNRVLGRMTSLLVVNADDFGISRGVNLGIEKAHREGILTSASLMANMPHRDHAAHAVVASNPKLGVGLHLCLTSGRSLSPPGDLPLLVDQEGRFCRGFGYLFRLLCSRRRDEALVQIAREFHAQANELDRLGLAIDHVDGHQHVQLLPGVFPIAAEIARQRSAFLRIPVAARRKYVPLAHRIGSWTNAGWLKETLLAVLSRSVRRATGNLMTASCCLGMAQSGRLTLRSLLRLLEAVSSGVTEIFSHPAGLLTPEPFLDCSDEDRQFVESPRRVRELEALTAPIVRDRIEALGLRLSTFRDAMPLA